VRQSERYAGWDESPLDPDPAVGFSPERITRSIASSTATDRVRMSCVGTLVEYRSLSGGKSAGFHISDRSTTCLTLDKGGKDKGGT